MDRLSRNGRRRFLQAKCAVPRALNKDHRVLHHRLTRGIGVKGRRWKFTALPRRDLHQVIHTIQGKCLEGHRHPHRLSGLIARALTMIDWLNRTVIHLVTDRCRHLHICAMLCQLHIGSLKVSQAQDRHLLPCHRISKGHHLPTGLPILITERIRYHPALVSGRQCSKDYCRRMAGLQVLQMLALWLKADPARHVQACMRSPQLITRLISNTQSPQLKVECNSEHHRPTIPTMVPKRQAETESVKHVRQSHLRSGTVNGTSVTMARACTSATPTMKPEAA